MVSTHLISNIAMMLAFTLMLILILAYLFKKFDLLKNYNMKDLELLGGANISKKNKLVLVKVLDQKLLLGVTDNQINTLYVFDGEFKDAYLKNIEQEANSND